MDQQKTGALIARRRKEKGLTQKELAERLHISDRTVSKWERSAGFPDISLLAPLADALDLSVAGLLRGEEIAPTPAEPQLRDSVALVGRQVAARLRRQVGRILAYALLLLFFAGFVFALLDYNGVFLKGVSLEVPAGVYVDGVRTGDCTVTIDGRRRNTASFSGRFAVSAVERTCRDGVTAQVKWNDYGPGYHTIQYWGFGGPWDAGVERQLYISETMQALCLKLADGTIISTDPYYVPLFLLDRYYPLAG